MTHVLRVETQAKLAAIVESSDDAIVSKTTEGIISTWNTGAERIFGYTAEEVIGKPITILIPEDRLDEEPQILGRISKGERVEHFETIRRRKDGRLIEVSVTISPIRDVEGRVVGASKIARDITEQKQIQRELKQAKEDAETANRAKDHLLSVISHELRTPLTPVLGAISFLEKSAVLPPPLQEQIAMIRRNIQTEAQLVDDLLDVTRITRGKVRLHFEAADAHALIREALADFTDEIESKGLAVTTVLQAGSHHIWADLRRFRQVLSNLVSNAVKFTPSGGTITLRSSNDGEKLTLEVIDSGIGIEPDVLPHVFAPFEQGERTVTRQYGGLGLGLSIVQALVDLHHGTVRVTSPGRDQGATFTVTMGTVPATRAKQPPSLPEMPSKRSCRVLLVEDHEDTRRVMMMLLRSFGCIVTGAGSVREALESAEHEEFDLLVSDIGLPDGTGIDVIRHLSERHEIKGIAVSGFGQEEDIRRSHDAGFETHLVKPVDFQTLHDVIDRLQATASPAEA